MTFSTFEFLGWFLPFFLAAYYVAPKAARNVVTLIFSIIFYTYGVINHPICILILFLSVFINYWIGVFMEINRRRKKPKEANRVHLIIGILLNVVALCFFKYWGYFDALTQSKVSMETFLPLGISFYTFQALSYIIDVYKRETRAELGFINFTNYMIMFPQLLCGPIVRYPKIKDELRERNVNYKDFLQGLEWFIFGLALKVVLSSRFSGLWNALLGIGYRSISVPFAWIGIVAYSLELYFDFYGYSLMAMGLGRMMGFTIPQNFNDPYMSTTMGEFWRRWHMTLGSWFKDYIYIPLGGNRKGAARTYFNLLVVWVLTGIWHGNGWNFVIWGLFLFLMIANERLWLGKVIEKAKWLGHIYMIILIPVSWMIFAITDLHQLKDYALRLIGVGGQFVYGLDFVKYMQKGYGVLLILGILFSTPLPRMLYKKIKIKPIQYVIQAVLLGLSIYMIYHGSQDGFMYTAF